MQSDDAIDQVRILSRAFDSWVVEFRIPVEELLDPERLLHHLRRLKQFIADSQGVPEPCLLFDGIVEKNQVGDEVDVVVRIKRKEIARGAPQVTFSDEVVSDEMTFSDMHAFLDIHYLDEFDQVITLDRVMRAIRTAGIDQELVQVDIVTQALQRVLETQSEVRGTPIAHGLLPGLGADAEVEFYFQAVSDSKDVDLLFSTRRVRRGDILCRKQPPAESVRAGRNVLGTALQPRQGLDFRLTAGANAILSLDGLDLVADADGVAVVTRTSRRIRVGRGYKETPDHVSVKVDPILRIDGGELTELVTKQAVEVVGNLRVGSRILSESEVYIGGNVEAGASISAAEDILVSGEVEGASLSSQASIVTAGSVSGSQLHARGDIDIAGTVRDSVVEGESVKAKSLSSSHVVARKSLTVESIDPDEGKIITTICVGMSDFFEHRLGENIKFIESARANLAKIKSVIGEDIFEQVTYANTRTMLMRLVTRLRLNTGSRKQIEVYRQLIEAVPPTRALVENKENECRNIRARLAEQGTEENGIIVIRERLASQVLAHVDGTRALVSAVDHGVKLQSGGDGLVITSSKDADRPNGNEA